MPHCIIEYSAQLTSTIKPSQLISAVHNGAFSTELFDEHDIKVRAMSFDDYQSGSIKANFIHVIARILSGRTLIQRQALSNAIVSELSFLNCSSTSITVEVVDIERESYAKIVTSA